jgi:hypothetical protein
VDRLFVESCVVLLIFCGGCVFPLFCLKPWGVVKGF